jgi:hypothetical protein
MLFEVIFENNSEVTISITMGMAITTTKTTGIRITI